MKSKHVSLKVGSSCKDKIKLWKRGVSTSTYRGWGRRG